MDLGLFDKTPATDRNALSPTVLPLETTLAESIIDPLPIHFPEAFGVGKSTEALQFRMVDHRISGGRSDDLVVSAHVPFRRMVHHTGANHIQVDIHQAADQMLVALHRGRMIPVLPKCAVSVLAEIEFLSGPAGDQLDAVGDDIGTVVDHQEVDVVRSGGKVQHLQPKPLLGLEKPVMPTPPVLGEFEEEFLLVAAVSNVPHLTRNMTTVSASHS